MRIVFVPRLQDASMLSAIVAAGTAADQGAEPPARARAAAAEPAADAAFRVEVERFADVGFCAIACRASRRSTAARRSSFTTCTRPRSRGREIIYDQKYRYNLAVKRTLGEVVQHYRR